MTGPEKEETSDWKRSASRERQFIQIAVRIGAAITRRIFEFQVVSYDQDSGCGNKLNVSEHFGNSTRKSPA